MQEAGVEVRLIEGDVTALRATGVGSDFRFLLDFGLFHDQPNDAQREAMGREVSAVAASGATMLMLAWGPGRRGPLPRGREPRRHRSCLSRVEGDRGRRDGRRAAGPGYVQRAEPRFYRLRRE